MKIGNNGITLVALIITIIVLLILVTVTISLVINNGILDHAQHGVNKYSEEEELEQIKLAVASAKLAGNGFLDNENLNNELHERIGENENAEKIGSNYYYNGFVISEDGNVEKYDKLLPKEYQQVEYLESSGTQYIDTLVQIKSTLKVILDASIKSIISGVGNAIFGVNNSDGGSFAYQINGNTKMLRCDFNTVKDSYSSYKVTEDTRHLWKKDKNVNYVDNTIIYTNTNSEFQTQYSIYLFGKYSTNNFGLSKLKAYNCEIYDSDILVRNFIPCYSTRSVTDVDGIECPAGTVGMYDTVNGQFYTNKGTGEFIAGPEV